METTPIPERLSLEPLPDLIAAEREWRRLASASDNVFSTWEWAEVWWRHFGDHGSLRLTRVRVGDEIVAILPLYIARRAGVRLARLVGHGVADQLGAVCDPRFAGAAIDEVIRSHGADVLLLERVPAQPMTGVRPGVMLREEASPVVAIAGEGGWEGYLAAKSANFRQQVRRRARSLSRLGLRYRLSDDPAGLMRDLDMLMKLHAARWGEQSRAFVGARQPFHREFAALALERGWLRLWIAEVDERPVAAWYGFRYEGSEYFYQSGRDPTWERHRVGAGLLEHTIREAFDDGMREYRLLRGDEAYKQRYASHTRSVQTLALSRKALGRSLIGLVRSLGSTRPGRAAVRRVVG